MLQRGSVVRSLLLCALFMSTLSSKTKRCGTQDGLRILETIREILLKEEDLDNTMLYTPDQEHYKSCPFLALDCMMKEMTVLLNDYDITDDRTKKILGIIKAQIPGNETQVQVQAGAETKNQTREQVQTGTETNNQTRDKAFGCDKCENFPVETPLVFLDSLNTTLRRINAECATKRELTAMSPSSQ